MWYIGQKVIYITGSNMPKYTVCLVTDAYDHPRWGAVISISKYPNRIWYASSFRPALDDSIEYAESLLNEIAIEINEENLVEK